MKICCVTAHIGAMDIIGLLQKLGHEVTIYSMSNHSHHMGWPRHDINYDESNIEAWVPPQDNYDLYVVYYPPLLALATAQYSPTIMVCPVRWDMCQSKYNKKMQAAIDEKRIIPVADSYFDANYVRQTLNRDCTVIRPVCAYANAPGPSGDYWGIDSHIMVPEYKQAVPIVSRDWCNLHYKGFISIPYNVSQVGIHERLCAGYPTLLPSKEFLFKLWWSKRAPCEVTWTASNNTNWEANIDKANWYSDLFKGIYYFNSWKHLQDILNNPEYPDKDGLKGYKHSELESLQAYSRIVSTIT